MEIDDRIIFLFLGCLVELLFPIHAIPHHFHHFSMHVMKIHEEEGLQIFIFFMHLWMLHEMLLTPKTCKI
jgi:hypothetical protein